MEECLPIQLLHKVYYYNIMTLLLVIYSLAANAPTSLFASIIDSTSINVSWTAPEGGANGYIIVYNDNTQQVSSTHTILSGLSPIVYNITVHGYKDVPSVGNNSVLILLNGKPLSHIIQGFSQQIFKGGWVFIL